MKKDDEKVLGAYQSAIQLQMHEGDLVWSRFSGFVVTHTIFFVLIGQILFNSSLPNRKFALIFFAIVGMLLTIFWLISTVRGYESVDYWNYSTYQLAFKIYGKNKISNLFINGKKYFNKNEEVFFNIGNVDPSHIRRSWLTRYIKIHTKWTAYLSIIVILVSYSIIIIGGAFGKFK